MKKLHRIIIAMLLAVCIITGGVFIAPQLSLAAPAPVITDYSAVFDAEYYYNAYPDLQQSIGNHPDALLNHFVTSGMKEGRNGNASFNVRAYMYNNLDLVAVYGAKDFSNYYIHYICHGQKEGRKALYEWGTQPEPGVLASYSTKYNVTEDRAINVELAAARVNGMKIAPGEKFSFSNSVGTRTIENGYVVAPSYAAGKVVTSVGGGICQVSSNIYIVMLLSGITPTQHYFHSLPVDYVPAGLDAAIVEGYKDLTFTNNFNFNIVINATTENGVLTVSFVKEAV
ncbi:MAG: VanW family protein [Lachnospiraceae bacterium]|nr:VanW family protein [Lachnospiraceae bacterium]